MRQVMRLVRYVLPFLLQLLPGVFLLAAVGFLEAFRLVLLKPVLDRVLNPSSGSENIVLFTMPQTGQPVYLQRFVPTHFHNAWTIVAYALVASTVLKGIFDYTGTYLVNHAGFGMITNLRNDLYNSVLRRSAAFFQTHATGTSDLHDHQRHRTRPVRHVEHPRRIPPAVLHLRLHRCSGRDSWEESWPGCW